ncbi:MAG: lectin-like protein [Lacipirellulaceae bacterium]
MNTPQDHEGPIDELANRVCDETITEGERDQLERLLASSRESRVRYLRYVMVNATLAWRYRTGIDPGSGGGQPDEVPAAHRAGLRRRPFDQSEANPARGAMLGSLAVCAAVAVIGGLWWVGRRADVGPSIGSEVVADATEVFVATLREASGGIHRAGKAPIEVGARVQAGNVSLDGGEAEFVFDSGARLVVQGPAELSIKNADAAFLRTGKAVVFVPERAIGFQLGTPTSLLIDQGTEFGVVAEESGATEVHVFKGQVDVVAKSSGDGASTPEARVAVLDREARRVEDLGTVGAGVEFSPTRFGGLVSRVGEPLRWDRSAGGNGHYYQVIVHGQPITWQAAAMDAFQRHHKGQPGHLVTVSSEEENRFVIDRLLSDAPQTRAWMGLTDCLREGYFRWITGEPVVFEGWASGPPKQPDNFHEHRGHGGEDYGIFTRFLGDEPWAWNDLSNDSIHESVTMSVVEFEPEVESLKHRSMTFDPLEWRRDAGGNGHYYRIVLALEPADWSTIRDRVRATSINGVPGRLVSFETPDELEFVVRHVLRVSGIPRQMVGFSGVLDGSAPPKWESGAPVDPSMFTGRTHPGHPVYGEFRWVAGKWELQAVADGATPTGWLGYIVEYDPITN